MTHYLSLCQEEQLSSMGKWLEFQNCSDISTEYFIMFFFTDRCPAWCCPSRRYAVWLVSSFVFMCANLVLKCVLTGRLLFAKIRNRIESSFSCSKSKTKSDKYHIHVCLKPILTNEWCWNVFSAHWLYYNTRSSRFIPRVLCFVCMFVVFAGPSKS